jgi:hypothetical protein
MGAIPLTRQVLAMGITDGVHVASFVEHESSSGWLVGTGSAGLQWQAN